MRADLRHGRHVDGRRRAARSSAAAAEALGRVDILVNNAGIQHVAPIEEFPVEKWDAIIAINLSSAFHTTRRGAARHARQRLGPHRQHRLGPRPRRLALQVGLRRRQARHRRLHQGRRRSRPPRTAITCNAICPGYVLTPLVEAQIADTDEAARHAARRGDPRGHPRPPALEAVRDRRADRRLRRLPLLATPPTRSPAPRSRSTAAGPAL